MKEASFCMGVCVCLSLSVSLFVCMTEVNIRYYLSLLRRPATLAQNKAAVRSDKHKIVTGSSSPLKYGLNLIPVKK